MCVHTCEYVNLYPCIYLSIQMYTRTGICYLPPFTYPSDVLKRMSSLFLDFP